ncbi:3'-5' exoribonuclease 1-like [Clytia hemisphaerica]
MSENEDKKITTKNSSPTTKTTPPPKQLNNPKGPPYSHPVYKKIAAANGRINRMSKSQVVDALEYLKLNPKGSLEVLQKRLKSHTKKQHFLENDFTEEEKKYTDFYIVIDFEATCEKENPKGYQHEIIEFPAVLVDADTLEVVSEFHSYCRPLTNPILSKFCRDLTGITQLTVESSSTFETVLNRFDKWLKDQVTPDQKFVIVTDGPWDIDRFLKTQCKMSKMEIPHYFQRWVNVRKHFNNFYKIHQVNVEQMLQCLGTEFVGRQHSGIDDSRNIARIMIELIKDGCQVIINETFR